jgi:hypothetical protein
MAFQRSVKLKPHNKRLMYKPWVDAGIHRTRTLGSVRLWLKPPTNSCPKQIWDVAIAGYGPSSGFTREDAISNARNK